MELREHLLREVEENFPALEEACNKLFGEEKSSSLLGRAQQFLPPEKYTFSSVASETPTYLFATSNLDTLFVVKNSMHGEVEFGAGTQFRQKPSKIVTSPILIFPEEGIRFHTEKYTAAGTDSPYFCTWLHEFSHYLVYLLQDKPYQAATQLLFYYFEQRGINGGLVDVLNKGMEKEPEAGTVLFSLFKTMEISGVYLQNCLMHEMGLPIAYSSKDELYCTFSRLSFGKFIDNVEHWHQLQAERSPYLHDFWEGLITIPVEKVPMRDY
ncbi:MAG: hypothetical protein AABY26_05755 [Nanoarchaeota archaeon]